MEGVEEFLDETIAKIQGPTLADVMKRMAFTYNWNVIMPIVRGIDDRLSDDQYINDNRDYTMFGHQFVFVGPSELTLGERDILYRIYRHRGWKNVTVENVKPRTHDKVRLGWRMVLTEDDRPSALERKMEADKAKEG